MLKIENLTIQYNQEKPILKNFHLTMKKGEIVCIVGESGSGKTTILKSILGILPSSSNIISGLVEYNEESILNLTNCEFRKLRGKKISMIFQNSIESLNPVRKIGSQYIEYIRIHSNLTKKEANDKAIKMLKNMHLSNPENIMKSYQHQLSGGMKQRIGIAMAMTFEPELLLADEPTSALDITTQAQIINQILELRNTYNTGIIIVTHNLGLASYIADKIIVMKNGEVMDRGTRDEIINYPKSDYTKKLLQSIPNMEE